MIDSNPQTSPSRKARVLLDPYGDWAADEKIPIHVDFGHDLIALETGVWDRYDARGCFAHTHGAGDFMTNYVIEVPPGRKTRPVKHIYEALFYVLTGNGSTRVWLPGNEVRTFEWGPNALFTVPLNCLYQFFNSSGLESARISCTNNAPLALNLYHNVGYVFDNAYEFPERVGDTGHFEGGGDYSTYDNGPGTATENLWETNFVHDLTTFKLYDADMRGKGSLTVDFILADGVLHSHVSQIPAGRYKKAHRHAAGTHVHAIDGAGYTLLWHEGDSEFKEIPWRHGVMYTPPFWMFHQHFNTAPQPARYVACSLGSRRYPFVSLRRKSAEGLGSVAVQRGGRQIEYEDQDPRIHRRWLDEITRNGVASKMGDLFDEPSILALPEDRLSGVIRTPRSVGPAV